jgi:hypothetical protein
MTGELKIALNKLMNYLFDLVHGLLPTNIIKRRLAHNHLKGEDADSPNIDTAIIAIALNNFRTDIIECATISLPPIIAIDSPTKIAQFTHVLNRQIITQVITMF